jgi:hypothetical protein
MDLKEICHEEVKWIHMGFCEGGNEPLGSIKG